MGELSPWHLLIVAFVFIVLFGAKKLLDAARSLGRSLRIFKAETQALSPFQPASAGVHGHASAAPLSHRTPVEEARC